MIEDGRIFPSALVTLAVIVALVATAALLLSRRDSDLSVAEAKRALETLPYPLVVRERPGEEEVLVGRAYRDPDNPLVFALARNPFGDGVPPGVRKDPNVTGGGGFLVYSNGEFGLRKGLPRRVNERGMIELEIEQALCRAATGEPCGI